MGKLVREITESENVKNLKKKADESVRSFELALLKKAREFGMLEKFAELLALPSTRKILGMPSRSIECEGLMDTLAMPKRQISWQKKQNDDQAPKKSNVGTSLIGSQKLVEMAEESEVHEKKIAEFQRTIDCLRQSMGRDRFTNVLCLVLSRESCILMDQMEKLTTKEKEFVLGNERFSKQQLMLFNLNLSKQVKRLMLENQKLTRQVKELMLNKAKVTKQVEELKSSFHPSDHMQPLLLELFPDVDQATKDETERQGTICNKKVGNEPRPKLDLGLYLGCGKRKRPEEETQSSIGHEDFLM